MSKTHQKEKKNKKNCRGNKRIMLAFGLSTLGTRFLSAISLAAIALSLCSLKQEATVFNACVEEVRETGQTSSDAVRFCNGG